MASLVASYPSAPLFHSPSTRPHYLEDDAAPHPFPHQRRASSQSHGIAAPRPHSGMTSYGGGGGSTAYETRPRSALSGSASPFAPQQRHIRRASSDHDLERSHATSRSAHANGSGDPPGPSRSDKVGAQAFDEVIQQPNPWTNPMPIQAFQDFSPSMQMPYGFGNGFPQGHSPPQFPPGFHFNGMLNGGGFAMPPGGANAFAAMSASQAQAWANFQAHSVAWQAMNGGQQHFAQQFGMFAQQPNGQYGGGGSGSGRDLGRGLPPNGSTQQRSLSAGNIPNSAAPAPASATPYHPYRRGPLAAKQTRDREASSSSATSSSTSSRSTKNAPAMSFAPGPAQHIRHRSSAQDVRQPEQPERFADTRRREDEEEVLHHPQPAFANGQPGQRSREGSPSGTHGRPRLDSTSSQTSNGRQVKPGRVPVPPYLGDVAVGTDAPAPAADTQQAPAHSRQSSSISSVGGPIKPTLQQTASSSSTVTARPAADSADAPSDASSLLTSPARSGGFNTPAQSPTTATSTPSSPPRDWKPSPLSQAEPVVSPAVPTRASVSLPRAAEEPTPAKSGEKVKSGGLKGRLQRALKKDEKDEKKQVNVSSPIRAPAVSGTNASPPSPSPPQVPPKAGLQTASSAPDLRATSSSVAGDLAMPARPSGLPPAPAHSLGARRPSNSSFAPSQIEPLDGKAKGKGRSLFSMKNASTDNISISSTVSSASMMIRKMGSLGKLARRNSLAGISKIFKDKKDSEEGVLAEEPGVDGKKPKKEKKRGLFGSKSDSSKAGPTTASNPDQAIPGLSPAAQLARQHTLRTKAEEKARTPVQQTFEATDAQSWDNNVRSRPGGEGAAKLPPLGSAIPPEAFASSQRDQYRPESPADDSAQVERDLYDSDEDAFDEDDADATVDDVAMRMDQALQMRDSSFEDAGRSSYESQEYAAWGQWEPDKFAVPARGILKAKSSFAGDDFQPPSAPWARTRSNSADGGGAITHEPGPLAKLAATSTANSIDGVKQGGDKSSENYDPFSPAFAPFDAPTGEREPLAERLHFPYANAALNTSAPALSKMPSSGKLPKATRAVTAPLQRKNLNWAPECAVYHTFHASEYDRRSEPATCNRLTPQLAQQIKDELNGYKMEEMDVHPSSRIHTHFFV